MAPASPSADEVRVQNSKLGRHYDRFLDWVPYATLAFSTASSLLISRAPLESRLTTLALAAVTAGWVYTAFTRLPSKHDASVTRVALYFFVMVGLGAALTSRDMVFFSFVTTGFFHAGLLRSQRVVVAGVAMTAIVVDSPILAGDAFTAGSVAIYLLAVVAQTLGISFGYQLHEKMEQLNTQRLEAFRARDLVLEENAGLHMQLLTRARETGVLDERQRMAREIHDTVAQGLAGIIAQLHAANATDDAQRHRRHLDSAVDLARDSLAEARRTVRAIGPAALETSQLSEALAEVSAKWSRSHTVPVELVTSGEARPMHPEVEVTLLRIAQEALTNVARHADAHRVGITLSYMEDQVALDVRDDGIGFEPSRVKADDGDGYGLAAMRQRVDRLDGSLSIESEPGHGTVVSASVPAILRAVADAS